MDRNAFVRSPVFRARYAVLARTWRAWERTMATHAQPFDPAAEAEGRQAHFAALDAHEAWLRSVDR